MKKLFVVFAIFATGVILFSFALSAQNEEHKRGEHPRIVACQGLTEGADCTFKMKDQDKNCMGKCKQEKELEIK